MRVGLGFDIHRLVADRPLYLGGLRIPYSKGLLGHSDGDALVHAIIDAILGACGLGDIGMHFPDNDPKLKGARSTSFLGAVRKMVYHKGFRIVNVDCTVFAEAPRLSRHKKKIRDSIANCLDISFDCVNVKAKTMEGLGAVGSGEAIAAEAVVLVEKYLKNTTDYGHGSTRVQNGSRVHSRCPVRGGMR